MVTLFASEYIKRDPELLIHKPCLRFVYNSNGIKKNFKELIDDKIAWVPNVSDVNERRTVKAVFSTAGCDVDFNEYIYLAFFINNVKNSDGNVNWSNIIYADELVMYKTVIGKADFERKPAMSNNYFNKIRLADDRFATYYLKAADGTLTEIAGNEIAGLEADTNYTFVAKWSENGRYYASEDYSEEISFKTLKYGDMNRDEEVDIIDLIVQKKGTFALSYDETYDLNADDDVNSGDLILLRRHLLNMDE